MLSRWDSVDEWCVCVCVRASERACMIAFICTCASGLDVLYVVACSVMWCY